MTPNNVDRKCLYCSQSDGHPKHETVHPGLVSVWAHMDCCAEVTGCEICKSLVDKAEGKRGEELRNFIMNGKG